MPFGRLRMWSQGRCVLGEGVEVRVMQGADQGLDNGEIIAVQAGADGLGAALPG